MENIPEREHVNVRVAFVPSVPKWFIFPNFTHPLRKRFIFDGSNTYHISVYDLRALDVERTKRDKSNAYKLRQYKFDDKECIEKYEALTKSIKTNGYDDTRPMNVMVCRKGGFVDSMKQGHHRMGICIENDIIFMIDEVQTGNGRTGELYAYMNYGVNPDVITTAKGLGGGLPIGACLMNEKTQNVLGFGDHGSTYGGNPVCASGALSVIKRLDDEFLSNVKKKSKYVFDELNGAVGIDSVSGMGLMVGIKTVKNAKDVVNKCIEKGVICLTAKDKVRLLPALNINDEDLAFAIQTIKQVCAE